MPETNPQFKEPSAETKEKKIINKIYFLIHPGYIGLDGILHSRFHRHNLQKPIDYYQGKSAELLSRYLERIKKINQDELLFIFAYYPIGRFKRDLKKQKDWAVFVKAAKSVLQDRLIVFSGEFNISHKLLDGFYSRISAGSYGYEETMQKIKNIIEARGYVFDAKKLESEIWGEIYNAGCVDVSAGGLKEGLKFKKSPKAVEALTQKGVGVKAEEFIDSF